MAYVIQPVHDLYSVNDLSYADAVGEFLSKMEKEGWTLSQVIQDHRDYSAEGEQGGMFQPGPMVGAMLVLHKPDELV